MHEKTEIGSIFPIFFLYLLPIAAWIAYTYLILLPSASWVITLIGLTILFIGTSLLFVFVRSGTKPPQEKQASALPVQEGSETHNESLKLLTRLEELQRELEERDGQIKQGTVELKHAITESQEIKTGLQSQISELTSKEECARQRIEELEIEAHQKQQGIQLLENQIHDLRYEIKTLLHLTEVDYGQIGVDIPTKEQLHLDQEMLEEPFLGPITIEKEAERLLKRCIQIAENMTPGYRASNLRALSSDPYAFDLRRLSDSLRLESGALILLYSPKEQRVQFAGKEAKTLLGWSSDRFSQEFREIAGSSLPLFEKGIQDLSTHSRVGLELPFTAKNKSVVTLQGRLGTIPSGIFRSLILCVFYLRAD
jgi:hypothetical protein